MTLGTGPVHYLLLDTSFTTRLAPNASLATQTILAITLKSWLHCQLIIYMTSGAARLSNLKHCERAKEAARFVQVQQKVPDTDIASRFLKSQ